MRTTLYALFGIVFSLGLRPPSVCAQAPDTTYLARGRSVFALFTNDKLQQLWAQFGPEMRGMARSVSRFEGFRKTILTRYGKETKVLQESVEHEGDLIVYVRESRFDKAHTPVQVRWSFHPDGKVAAFQFQMRERRP